VLLRAFHSIIWVAALESCTILFACSLLCLHSCVCASMPHSCFAYAHAHIHIATSHRFWILPANAPTLTLWLCVAALFQDLNWKDQCAKEKRELAAIERRNRELEAAGGRVSSRLYHPDRFFGVAGSLASPEQFERPQGKSSKFNPVLHEDTFSNLFPGVESPVKTRSRLAEAGMRAIADEGADSAGGGSGSAGPETNTAANTRVKTQAQRRGAPRQPPAVDTTKTNKKLRHEVRKAKLQQKAAKMRIARRRAEERARILQAELERQSKVHAKHGYKTRHTVMP